MELFVFTPHCTSRMHCGIGKCRDRQGGRAWRESLSTGFELPGGDVDFVCPHGLPWLETPSEVATVPARDKIKLRLRCGLSPGDIVMVTGAVRDLHLAAPGKYLTEVRTSSADLWQNNPYVTKFREPDGHPGVRDIQLHYHQLLNESHRMPYHFLHGYVQDLERHTGERIPVTQFKGDLYLSAAERAAPSPVERVGVRRGAPYAVMMAGGKHDCTTKWWSPASYQAVVDHFRGRLTFVQCGSAGDWHPPLRDAPSLVGKTNLREFLRVIHRAELVVCPITFAMHAAAAVPRPSERKGVRPCVVIAGGREPPHFTQYPGHQFLSTLGQLDCCASQACWASYAHVTGSRKPDCHRPLKVLPDLAIPECMTRVTPDQVIAAIEGWISGGMIETTQAWQARMPVDPVARAMSMPVQAIDDDYVPTPVNATKGGCACKK